MKQIVLSNILDTKSYPDAGTEFCGILRETIQDNETIQIDMKGVNSMPTMFMNTSFGKIMSEFGVEKLKKVMIFQNITKVQIERIGKYLKDYAEVYQITN
ncbi:STAS-like domain-containing protein [uncultured Bacteroides sp.]|uniref:STAS-like domain-containing protein n=1 Tax=uncultured Bacteroides sp. TaxID=162156 RepID=UPI002AAB0817|nr:STAS-like domain-containing protein [uncultured Bacteroides sp.]